MNCLHTRENRATIATYNIHQSIGRDRKRNNRRIIRVVDELGADVVALQEVDTFHAKTHIRTPIDYLKEKEGYNVLLGPTMEKYYGDYGNVLLTKQEIVENNSVTLNITGREPRGAIDATLKIHNKSLRVVVTHLGLKAWERLSQVNNLLDLVRDDPNPNLVLLGDFNEWSPFSRCLRAVHRCFAVSPFVPTYPSIFPLLALDRIWLRPGIDLRYMGVHKSPLSRVASDHLPLKAVIGLA